MRCNIGIPIYIARMLCVITCMFYNCTLTCQDPQRDASKSALPASSLSAQGPNATNSSVQKN